MILLLLNCLWVSGQDDLLKQSIQKCKSTFSRTGNSFTGRGWEMIDSAVRVSNQVLIGEDHFLNEVPFFISAIARNNGFQNFIIEVDPYSVEILEKKIASLTEADLGLFIKQWQTTFSFYGLKPEMELLRQMVKSGAKVGGTEQISLMSDRLICHSLKMLSKNKEAIRLYEQIARESARHLEQFVKDRSKPFYMLTPAFDSTLTRLLQLPLSTQEKQQLQDLKLSKRIYAEGNHWIRLQLMKSNFYNYYYPKVTEQKTLYKFGSNHMTKGEGILGGYDIGNVVYNIADSRYEKSLHIMIVGKEGWQGSPFKNTPPTKLYEGSDGLKAYGELEGLKVFFEETGKEWTCFDLTTMHRPIRRGELKVEDIFLRRILQGFDYLVVIPEVTAATMN
ncbi:MAG: hypothetical protein ACKOE5_08400 [Cytophagales bacterium]